MDSRDELESLRNGDVPIPEIIGPIKAIAGVWRRIFAFIIDGIFLGLIGSGLGLIFKDYFIGLGGYGVIVGFIIAGAYYGILNSDIGGGQTVGKKLLKIKVINARGENISVAKSALRFLVIGVPLFLNGAQIPNVNMMGPIGILIGMIVFGGSGAIVYLFLFNKSTRQSLHDFAVGSYVIDSKYEGEIEHKPIWKGHVVIVVVLCISGTLFMTVGVPFIFKNGPFPDMLEIQQKLLNTGKYGIVNVIAGETKFNSNKKTFIGVKVTLREKPEDIKKSTKFVAATVYETYPKLLGRETLFVTTAYGYDIGIASYWQSYNDNFPVSIDNNIAK
jgi:uncharacterized RDD family membrane protein YckC